jgi:hypothetical protein
MFDIYKVGAGIGGDATKVSRDYDISIKGVEDLSYHANQKLGGGLHKWGLASLTEKLLSKQVCFVFNFLKIDLTLDAAFRCVQYYSNT